MNDIALQFEERVKEIDAYLELLVALEDQVKSGIHAEIGGKKITTQQHRILYSSVYLQLYNLVEATVTWCIEAVGKAISDARWHPAQLCPELVKEWIRYQAKTHEPLSVESRFEASANLFNRMIHTNPMGTWKVEKSGGNWDDKAVEDFVKRIGVKLKISAPVYKGVKRFIREERGALELIKFLRNQLAHGFMSFEECGADVTVSELADIRKITESYLKEVIDSFREFIGGFYFLSPASRLVAVVNS